jgi:hypothetical protein
MSPGTYFLPDTTNPLQRNLDTCEFSSRRKERKRTKKKKERKKERWPSPSGSGAVLLNLFF